MDVSSIAHLHDFENQVELLSGMGPVIPESESSCRTAEPVFDDNPSEERVSCADKHPLLVAAENQVLRMKRDLLLRAAAFLT